MTSPLSRTVVDPLIVVIIAGPGPHELRGLESVLRHTRGSLHLVDDACGVALEAKLSATSADALRIQVNTNDEPRGLPSVRDQALALGAGTPVVVVDSEIEVGPRWLQEMLRVAELCPEARSVVATCCSEAGESSAHVPWPGHLDWGDISRAAARLDLPRFSEVPDADHAGVELVVPAAESHLLSPGTARRVSANRVLARAWGKNVYPAGPADAIAASVRALAQELRAEPQIAPRRLYVVERRSGDDLDDLVPWLKPLSDYQESYVLVVDETEVQLRAGPPSFLNPPREASDRRGTISDLAEFVASAVEDLRIELVHVVGTELPALPRTIDRLHQLRLPVVVSYEERSASAPADLAAHPDLLRIAVVDNGARAALGARRPELAPLAVVIGARPDLASAAQLRVSRVRRPGPPRVLVVPGQDADFADALRAVADEVGPEVEWHAFADLADGALSFAARHGVRAMATSRAVLGQIDPDVCWLSDDGQSAMLSQVWTAWSYGLPVFITASEQAAADGIAELGCVPVEAAETSEAATCVRRWVVDERELRRFAGSVPPMMEASPVEVQAAALLRTYQDLEPREPGGPSLGLLLENPVGRLGSCEYVRVLGRTALAPARLPYPVRQLYVRDLWRGEMISAFDTLLIQRRVLREATEAALTALAKTSVRLVHELDDDLMNVGVAVRTGVTQTSKFVVARVQLLDLIAAVDRCIVSTDGLAGVVAQQSSEPPVVVRNDLDPRLWLPQVRPVERPDDGTLRVLYMGTRTHALDAELLRDVIPKLAPRLGRPVVFEVVGVVRDTEAADWFTRIEVPPGCEVYPLFVRWLRTQAPRWDAAVAPLIDDEFNRSKSDLKLLEYAALGVPVVASAAGPYRDQHILARLTTNEPDAWCDAMVECLRDVSVTRAAAAQDHVLRHRMITEEGARQWFAAVMG